MKINYTAKIKQTIFLFLIIFHCINLSQSQNIIDSLLFIQKTAKADTNKVNILNQIGTEYSNTGDYKNAAQKFEEAVSLSQDINFKKGILTSLKNIENIFLIQDNYPKALENCEKILQIQNEMGDKNQISNTLNAIGYLYFNQGNYSKALENYLQCLKISEEINDKQNIASSLGNVANVYSQKGNYQEALKFYFQALKAIEVVGNKNALAGLLDGIGTVYGYQAGQQLNHDSLVNSYSKALKYFLQSLKIREESGGGEME